MASIPTLGDTARPDVFELVASPDLCVGPLGNIFLFGGAGLAGAIAAMERRTGQRLIYAASQYSSYARAGDRLEIEVSTVAAGKQVTQARADARIGGATIFTVAAALGDRTGWPAHQWRTAPDIPPPDRCREWPIWPVQGGGLLDRFEVRLEPEAIGRLKTDGTVDAGGRLTFWLRAREAGPVDAALLAIAADFVPSGVAAALGRLGGGNSLDNSLRIGSIVPTRWLLCDVAVDIAARGIAHGDIRIFAEDGTLMATGSQSLALRFLPS